MPRSAREKVENSIYHVCARGNNKQDIFLDDKDREEYLNRLNHYKEKYKVRIYAYCLMTNHVHILVYDNNQDISKFMHGLNLSYAIYFNNRHGRVGHLFQERFTSILVKSNTQLLYTSRYIHLNPVKANLVNQAQLYKWSSYKIYAKEESESNIVDTSFLLSVISDDQIKSRRAYVQYIDALDIAYDSKEVAITLEKQEDKKISLHGMKKMSYQEAYQFLCGKWNIKEEKVASYMNEKGIAIYLLGLLSRLSWSQVARNLGIHEMIAYKKVKNITYMMIKDKAFCNEVDKLLFCL